MALIVVIDDEATIRVPLRKALVASGHTVEDFPDAAPALNSPSQHVADFPRPPPVIVMSGYITEEDWKRIGELGTASFVEKPFKILEMIALVDRYADAGRPESGEGDP